MRKGKKKITKGDIVTVDAPINAYNDSGSSYRLEAGLNALVIDINNYDLIIYTCGVVLYCSTDVNLMNVV